MQAYEDYKEKPLDLKSLVNKFMEKLRKVRCCQGAPHDKEDGIMILYATLIALLEDQKVTMRHYLPMLFLTLSKSEPQRK